MDTLPPPLPAAAKNRPPAHPARGWLLVVLGVILSGGMAYLANWLHQAILHNGDPGTRSHWAGSAAFTHTVFELFGAVFVFGLVSIAAGVHILRTRRISRALAAIMVAVVLVIVYLGYKIVNPHDPR